jgi:hypothetical protein
MLHEFLADNRDKIIARTREMVANRSAPSATDAELEHGIPLLLTQLGGMLQVPLESSIAKIESSAAKHGDELQRMGFSVGQVVHDYGSLCQAITQVAIEDRVSITSGDFQTLNGCLDDAIASAVSEFGRQREQSVSDEGAQHLESIVRQLRNALNVAIFAFDTIKTGTVGASGATGAMLASSLDCMRETIDRSLAEVRLQTGTHNRIQLSLAALVEELGMFAGVEAQRRGMRFTVEPVKVGVTIDGDSHLLTSALTNLLRNALKFTRPNGHVSLRTIATADRVRIEIEDECGGLPAGKLRDIFRVFEQLCTDRKSGLAITRAAVEANRGTIEVRDLPGQGCIFAIDLPRDKQLPV